jgi:hypothetical protein
VREQLRERNASAAVHICHVENVVQASDLSLAELHGLKLPHKFWELWLLSERLKRSAVSTTHEFLFEAADCFANMMVRTGG